MWLTASLAEADGKEEAGRTARRHAMRRDAGWCPATWCKFELTRPRTALVGEPGEARARQAHRRLRLATPGPRRATSARARTSSISDGLALAPLVGRQNDFGGSVSRFADVIVGTRPEPVLVKPAAPSNE